MTGRPRITIITGAASGIGRAVSNLLAGRGERVIGVDLNGADIAADLADDAVRAKLATHLLTELPQIDAVISCAGVSLPNDGARTVSVNFFGATRLLTRLLPRLTEAPAPRVVVISSIASLFPPDRELVDCCLADDEARARLIGARDGNKAYASSKRALTQWIRRTATGADFAGRGVLLNGIAPGTIKTAMANPILTNPEGRAMLAKAVPIALGDYADPGEIAPLIAFLASADNRFMVGQVPFVDGGSDVLLRGDEPL